jgi:hypothetical protein
MDGVVFVFENRRMVLQTTLSWDFNWNVLPHYSIMGLPLSAERNLQYESDIIIGMFLALFPQNGKEHAKLLHPPISPATGNNMVLLDIHYIVLKKIS